MAAETLFGRLSDDVVLKIFSKLEDDPRHWARLACACTKFSSLIRTVCWKAKCSATIPAVAADLLGPSSSPSAWSSLFKLAVCCPGLLHAGVLLEHSDFGLELELGPDDDFPTSSSSGPGDPSPAAAQTQDRDPNPNPDSSAAATTAPASGSDCAWSLFDDLYFDTVYSAAEDGPQIEEAPNRGKVWPGRESSSQSKRRKICRSMRSHLASGVWNLSREQGNKLLASRFRGDSLYICDWPGCIHIEEKRNYMLFRGVFKNFKRSRVWRTINDGNRNKLDLNCAFCSCKETWDLLSAFCLRRGFGYHDDGEPVVRAYVCENGHVSGAWTDLHLYS